MRDFRDVTDLKQSILSESPSWMFLPESFAVGNPQLSEQIQFCDPEMGFVVAVRLGPFCITSIISADANQVGYEVLGPLLV